MTGKKERDCSRLERLREASFLFSLRPGFHIEVYPRSICSSPRAPARDIRPVCRSPGSKLGFNPRLLYEGSVRSVLRYPVTIHGVAETDVVIRLSAMHPHTRCIAHIRRLCSVWSTAYLPPYSTVLQPLRKQPRCALVIIIKREGRYRQLRWTRNGHPSLDKSISKCSQPGINLLPCYRVSAHCDVAIPYAWYLC